MNDLRRAATQLGADLRVFVRNPAALFFTAILPVIFLVMFVSIFGNQTFTEHGRVIRVATLQVPAFIGLAVVSSSFVALAMGLTRARENGVLKRTRGTPVPPWVIFAGRIGSAILVAALITVLLAFLGAVAFHVSVPTHTLPGLLATLAVGAAALCALGIAYTRVIPSEEAAPALTNIIVLPLYFISGVFVPANQLPHTLRTVAHLLPVQPFVHALSVAFDPRTTGAGFAGSDLAVLAGWGVIGLVLAVRFFGWTPRHLGS